VVILWLDNLGAFYPLIAELGLSNIAAAFEGGTTVRHLIGPVPWVTEADGMRESLSHPARARWNSYHSLPILRRKRSARAFLTQ